MPNRAEQPAGETPALQRGGPRGWRYRGYLPHFDGGEMWQTVTFRLADSFPTDRLEAWKWELRLLSKEQADQELHRRIEEYLDEGHGARYLRRPDIADTVQDTLSFFDEQRYRVDAWVLMPNHVHVLFLPLARWSLSTIVHSWKSYSAKQANRILGRSGRFWQEDYRDRYIRDDEHFLAARVYIENNPVKAGLCTRAQDWAHGSARFRVGSAGVPPA